MHLIDLNEFVQSTGQLKKTLLAVTRGLRVFFEKPNLYIGLANLAVTASVVALMLLFLTYVFHLRISIIVIVAGATVSAGSVLCLIFCLRALVDHVLRRNGVGDYDPRDTY